MPLTGRRRARRVPFGEIAALSNVQNAVDDLLTLTTRDGERFVLPPGLASGEGLIRVPDQAALDAFAGLLQAAIAATGAAAPPVADGLGFWNRPPGLALLGILPCWQAWRWPSWSCGACGKVPPPATAPARPRASS